MTLDSGKDLNQNTGVPLKSAAQEPEKGSRYYSGIDWLALFFHLLDKVYWIVLAALLGAAIAGVYVKFLVTPLYQATSKIYIAGSETTISLSDLQLGSSLATDYQEVFKIWHVHELVDEKLNLNYSYGELANMISVSNPSGSHLLYIQVKSPDPEEARLLADTYAEVVQQYISEKMDLRKPQILEKARKPGSPVSPNIRGTVIRGFIFGALAAVAILVLVFLVDDRIRSADDVEKMLSLPTFGMVNLQRAQTSRAESEAAKQLPKTPHTAIIRENLELDYTATEAFNSICSSISFAGSDLRRIAVTSCGANNGKTYVSMQIAAGMARRGKKVLMMDGDLRLSVLANRYGIQLSGSGFGLAHVLSGQCGLEDAVYHTNISNLWLLPVGATVKTPLSLLTSEDFPRMMSALRGAFDLIIVDTPPVGVVVDAADISRHCDGVLLVLEYNTTHARAVKEVRKLLEQTGTPVLGCVLNKVALKGLDRKRYGYQYGYYDRYSADDKQMHGRHHGRKD